PLGGSRGGRWRTCRNILINMLLGGLWHGAAWTFVIWGGLHAGFLILHRLFRDLCEARPAVSAALESIPGTVCRIALTYLCVCVAWVFFRATTFAGAVTVLKHMVVRHPGLPTPMPPDSLFVLAGVIGLCSLFVL